MVKIGAGLVIAVIALLVLYFLFKGDEAAAGEERYDGVHMCSPSQQQAATAQARAAPPSEPRAGTGNEGPFFAQNSSIWGREEYDHGGRQDIGCGTTIEQCGCAMTSVATVMHLFEVVNTPGGEPLDPSTMNAWFNQNAQLTARGWVSTGYAFGSVVWAAINGWRPEPPPEETSSEIDPTVRDDSAASLQETVQGMRFAGWGTGSEDEIRRELEAGRPVVLEVPGHYIAAVALDGDVIRINDPAYADRTTLDAYAGRVLSARLFEPGDDFRSIMVTVPSNLRIEITDSQGRKVGTLGGSDPKAAQAGALSEIPGAVTQYQGAWRDPTCTERAPPEGAGTISVFIPLPETGTYHVVVVNPDGGDSAAAVHTNDIQGNQGLEVHDGGSRIEFDIDYGEGEPPEPPEPATPTPTPTPTATPTEAPIPPSITPEPDTPTPTPTVTPLAIESFTVTLDEINQDNPCRTSISWSVTGNPEGTVRLLRAFGASISNDDADVLIEGPPGQGSYVDPFVEGPWTYRLLVTSPEQNLSQTVTVEPICIQSFRRVDASCCSIYVGWFVEGTVPKPTYTLSREDAGIIDSGPVIYDEPQTYGDLDMPCGTTHEYTLRVFVAERTVTTNPITLSTNPCSILVP